MAKFFITRPVFAIVTALVLLLAGIIAGFSLPIAQYPQITLPTVRISAFYPGANAEVVEQAIAQPIEEQVNGVEGMLYMSSSSSGNGAYSLNITFGLDSNADIAAVQVQNRAAQANSRLPGEVLSSGVTTKKQTPDTLMYVALVSPKGTYDDLFLTNYATINVVEALKRVKGVGNVHDPKEFMRVTYEKKKILHDNAVTGQGLPTYGNRLEVFAAHDSAHARTASGTVHVVYNGCKQDAVFTGFANARNTS